MYAPNDVGVSHAFGGTQSVSLLIRVESPLESFLEQLVLYSVALAIPQDDQPPQRPDFRLPPPPNSRRRRATGEHSIGETVNQQDMRCDLRNYREGRTRIHAASERDGPLNEPAARSSQLSFT